ncbi:hypothetical protein [Fervidobacterium sp.]
MEATLWVVSILTVFVDNVYKEYFTLAPLYFLLESVLEESPKIKLSRLLMFSTLYQSFAYRELDFVWVIVTVIIIVVELYRENFYYPWTASLLQAVFFLLPYYFSYPVALIYGFVLDCMLFAYIYKKLELGGA